MLQKETELAREIMNTNLVRGRRMEKHWKSERARIRKRKEGLEDSSRRRVGVDGK